MAGNSAMPADEIIYGLLKLIINSGSVFGSMHGAVLF